MGISIQDKSVVFSDDFPIIGNIVRNDVLKWGIRPVNALSSINLAETTATVQAVNNPKFSGNVGFYRQGANLGYFKAVNFTTDNVLKTLYLTFSIDTELATGTYDLAGNFQFAAANRYPSSIGLKIEMKSDGLYLLGFAPSINGATVDNSWATLKLSKTSGTFCVAVTQSTTEIKVHELNANTSATISGSFDISTYTGTLTNKSAFFVGTGEFTATDAVNVKRTTHECFYFNDVLTDSELQQQKEYSKLILNAKNIDVSSWT